MPRVAEQARHTKKKPADRSVRATRICQRGQERPRPPPLYLWSAYLIQVSLPLESIRI